MVSTTDEREERVEVGFGWVYAVLVRRGWGFGLVPLMLLVLDGCAR
jgi:hypothetical protein